MLKIVDLANLCINNRILMNRNIAYSNLELYLMLEFLHRNISPLSLSEP